METKQITEARKLLRDAGYYVDNLWHISDVMTSYECSESQAQEILDFALTNDATFTQIWFAIGCEADNMDLKHI